MNRNLRHLGAYAYWIGGLGSDGLCLHLSSKYHEIVPPDGKILRFLIPHLLKNAVPRAFQAYAAWDILNGKALDCFFPDNDVLPQFEFQPGNSQYHIDRV